MFEELLVQLVAFIKTYIIFWLLFVFLELLFPYKKQKIFSGQFLNEIVNGLFNTILISPINKIIYTLLLVYVFTPYLPFQLFNETIQTWPFALQFLAGVVLMDFIQYTRHRFTHRFIWDFHATHHAALELRPTSHFRMHPLDYIVSHFFTVTMMYILGFEGHIIAWSIYFATIHNMWLHVNINLDYGFPLRHVFASPNYHKWHHAKGAEGKDKNFADIFPIFDILGGTYYYPKGQLPESYGVMRVDNTDPLYQSFSGAFMYPFKEMYKQFKKRKASS